jgi:hypothetical protein
VIPRKSTRAGTQESRRQTQSPNHSVEDPKSRAYKSFDQLAREYVDENQKITRELGLLAPERNSCKPRYLKRRTKTRIDESHRLNKIVNRTAPLFFGIFITSNFFLGSIFILLYVFNKFFLNFWLFFFLCLFICLFFICFCLKII